MANDNALSEIIASIRPADAGAMRRAQSRQRILTKPPGSLGRLEDLSVQLAGIFGDERPRIGGKAVIVAAGDHGVVAQGVTGYPQTVTAQMVANFLAGGAAVSVLARQMGARQIIVDAGVAADLPAHPELLSVRIGSGTADISASPAMTRGQAERSILAGAEIAMRAAAYGADIIAAGEMGIGNSTAASAITAAFSGKPPQQTTGAGTGRNADELAHKAAVVQCALDVNMPNSADGVDVLAKVGGFEIGVLAGVALGAASMRRAVIVDGFISGAAMLIAQSLCATARDYMIASHRSAEKGHGIVLAQLGLLPLLELDMRLGEGSGAALAMPIVEAAAACLSEMATFGEAGVADRPDGADGESGGTDAAMDGGDTGANPAASSSGGANQSAPIPNLGGANPTASNLSASSSSGASLGSASLGGASLGGASLGGASPSGASPSGASPSASSPSA